MTREEQRQLQREKVREQRRREREAWEASRGPMDLPFLLLVLMLTVIGLIMLLSASFPSAQLAGDALYYFKRQAIFAVLGVLAMFSASKINYQRFRGLAKIGLIVSLALLVLVAALDLAGLLLGVLLFLTLLATTKPILGRGYLYPLIPFDGKALGRLLVRQPISRKNS